MNPLIIIIRGVVSGHWLVAVAVARAALRYYVTALYNIDAREEGGAGGRGKDEGTK